MAGGGATTPAGGTKGGAQRAQTSTFDPSTFGYNPDLAAQLNFGQEQTTTAPVPGSAGPAIPFAGPLPSGTDFMTGGQVGTGGGSTGVLPGEFDYLSGGQAGPGRAAAGAGGPTDLFNQQLGSVQKSTGTGVVTGSSAPAPGGKGGAQTAVDAMQSAGSLPEAVAAGFRQAGIGTAQAMQYQPMNIQAQQISAQGYTPTGAAAQSAGAQGYQATRTGSRGYAAERAGSTGFEAALGGAQGYDAALADARGYEAERAAAERARAERAAAQGYGAERIAGAGPVREERVAAGQLAGTSLDPYFNPYESQVVQQSLSDIERARQMQQNVQGAQAQAAGAFGGSREAIAQAETNRAFAEQAARTASGLRQAGFTQAQQAAQQDITARMQANLANQQAALQAGTTTAQLGQQAQLANQAAQNQAAQFGAQAGNVAALQNAQLGTQAALQNAQLGTQANLANQAAANQAAQFGAQAANVAALQNAAAQNQAAQFSAAAQNQQAMANQAALNQAAQFGAQAQNVAGLQNAQLGSQAAQFGAQAANVAALQNAAAQNAAAQFGAQAGNVAALQNASLGTQANLQNAAAANAAAQFGAQAGNTAAIQNQQAALQAALANQGAGLTATGQQLQAAGQLGNLANLGFGAFGTMNQAIAQQGALERAAQQAIIDAANQQYAGFTGSPQQALQTALGAFAGSQTGQQTQTTQRNPGLIDYLTLAASDIRLKENIQPIGKSDKGINLYTWDWNEEGKRIAGNQPTIGVLAQELREVMPEAVTEGPDGYLRVNYLKVL